MDGGCKVSSFWYYSNIDFEIGGKMEKIEISKEMSVNQVIKVYPQSIGVFNKFNIDSCCGGSETLEKAAKNAGVKIEEVIEAIYKSIKG